MTVAPSAAEKQRLAALYRYELLDTPAEADFDFLAELAAQVCGTPYAAISLIDRARVWMKASHGMPSQSRPRDQDLGSLVISGDSTLLIADLAEDPRSASLAMTAGPPTLRMLAGASLETADGHRIGALCVFDSQPRTLSGEQLEQLRGLSRQVMALIELRAQQRALAEATATMERLATIDDLTGLGNRRMLLKQLDDEVERAQRFDTPLSVILVDLDHFKRINDSHGHAMGDAVLRNVGTLVRGALRQFDVAGRYGGEELCLLLPGTSQEGAVSLAESLRVSLEEYVHIYTEKRINATASFGVASLAGADEPTSAALLKAADEAMSRAKSLGRNRVE